VGAAMPMEVSESGLHPWAQQGPHRCPWSCVCARTAAAASKGRQGRQLIKHLNNSGSQTAYLKVSLTVLLPAFGCHLSG
jgi:hypothetical protein